MKRSLWSLMHLVGAAIFVLVMITRVAQSDALPAITTPDTSTTPERLAPFDPVQNQE